MFGYAFGREMSTESSTSETPLSVSNSRSESSTSSSIVDVKFTSDLALRKHQLANQVMPDPFLGLFEKPLYKPPQSEKECKLHNQILQDFEPTLMKLASEASGMEQQPAGMLAFTLSMSSQLLRCQRCKLILQRPVQLSGCACRLCLFCALESADLGLLRAGKVAPKCPVCGADAAHYTENRQLARICQHYQQIFRDFASPTPQLCSVCGETVQEKKAKRQYSDDKEIQEKSTRCVVCARIFCSQCIGKAVQISYLSKETLELTCAEFSFANETEQKFMQDQFSQFEIMQRFLEDLYNNYYLPIKFSEKRVDIDDICCLRCLPNLYAAALCWERSKLVRKDREECPFGTGCKQQLLDAKHQAEFSHGQAGCKGDGLIYWFW